MYVMNLGARVYGEKRRVCARVCVRVRVRVCARVCARVCVQAVGSARGSTRADLTGERALRDRPAGVWTCASVR